MAFDNPQVKSFFCSKGCHSLHSVLAMSSCSFCKNILSIKFSWMSCWFLLLSVNYFDFPFFLPLCFCVFLTFSFLLPSLPHSSISPFLPLSFFAFLYLAYSVVNPGYHNAIQELYIELLHHPTCMF